MRKSESGFTEMALSAVKQVIVIRIAKEEGRLKITLLY